MYLTGAGSNIDPTLYGQENLTPEKGQDRDRDLFDLPLIKAAIARGLPVFGICRGMQEIQRGPGRRHPPEGVCRPGFNDHRENPGDPVAVQYAEAHKVRIEPNNWLARVLGRDEIGVSSLHGQGIKTPGQGLEPLARAEDGLIEAFHAPSLSPFLFAVQWHPELAGRAEPGFGEDVRGVRRGLPSAPEGGSGASSSSTSTSGNIHTISKSPRMSFPQVKGEPRLSTPVSRTVRSVPHDHLSIHGEPYHVLFAKGRTGPTPPPAAAATQPRMDQRRTRRAAHGGPH